MGVRGTDFTVTAPESGDVLVTCDEGEVSVTDDQGKDLTAIPGTVVEKIPGEAYRTVPVAATGLEDFRTRWRGERAQFVQANALRFITGQREAVHHSSAREFNGRSPGVVEEPDDHAANGPSRTGRARSAPRPRCERERRPSAPCLCVCAARRSSWKGWPSDWSACRRCTISGIGVGDLEDGMTTKVFYAQVARERQDVCAETRTDTIPDKAVPEAKRGEAAIAMDGYRAK